MPDAGSNKRQCALSPVFRVLLLPRCHLGGKPMSPLSRGQECSLPWYLERLKGRESSKQEDSAGWCCYYLCC